MQAEASMGRGGQAARRVGVLTAAAALLIGIALVAGAVTRDEAAPAAGFSSVSDATLAPGAPAPAPEGEPVLVVEGAGTGTGIRLDLPTLERLGLVEATITEPFLERKMTFRGVELGVVLAAAGLADQDVRLVALDDYVVQLTADEIRRGGILVATAADGEPIPVANGGPTRVVFLDGIASGADTNQWIWSLERIEPAT
jgi:hypothetical protein